MSWYLQAVGKPEAVTKAIKAQNEKIQCIEPEESVKNSVVDLIELTLKTQRSDSIVQVSANGSMYTSYNEETKQFGAPLSQSVELKIQPLPGFVE